MLRWLAWGLALWLAACGPSAQEAEWTRPYPRASWRLARERLADIALTTSHILITHARSSTEGTQLRAPGWRAENDSKRTLQEARQIAVKVAQEARSAPDRFAQLAAQYSDDLATRDRGGSLGTWSADLMPPAFLDALSAMKPGETSRVVSTELGLHVIQRRPLAPEAHVAAFEIVIAYDAIGPTEIRQGREVTRSRAQAQQLAQRVAALAKADGTAFPRLVAEYSDHVDFERDGDIGSWSTHRAFVFNRELELIAGMGVGETSEPLDTARGFKIFQRRALDSKPALAAERIRIAESDAPDKPLLPKDAAALANKLRALLQTDPTRFAQFQQAYCCRGVEQWEPGHTEEVKLEIALADLQVGELAGPIETSPGVFDIVKRSASDETKLASRPITDVLPDVKTVDLSYWVRNAGDPEGLARYILRLGEGLEQGMAPQLNRGQVAQVRAIFTRMAEGFKSRDAEQRVAVMTAARIELQKALPSPLFASLEGAIQQRLTTELLSL